MPSQKDKVLLDTNVILRYLLKDHEEFFEKAKKIFDEILSGRMTAQVLQAVLAEVVYVLEKLYRVEREEITEVLSQLLRIKRVHIKDKEIVLKALELYNKKKIDFVDALLCAYGSERDVISFDKDVQKCLGL